MLNIDAVFAGDAFKGKRVLVTGTNRGIGLALVRELSRLGAVVVATVRRHVPTYDAYSSFPWLVQGPVLPVGRPRASLARRTYSSCR